MRTRRAAVLQIACVATGCSGLLPPADAPPALALLDQLPAHVSPAAHARGVMLALVPTCRPAYDTTRMAYTPAPHELAFFARHEWAERPAQMLQPLLVRTLQAARCCTAVVAAPHSGPHDFSLRTQLRELVQDFSADPPLLRLALRIEIEDRTRTLAARDLAFTEPLRERNAEAGVAAANDAVARALLAVARLVTQALA